MIIRIIVLVTLGLMCYVLGCSHAQTQVVTKQIEVIKYVEQKKSQIHSRPNASRDILLKLMQDDKL